MRILALIAVFGLFATAAQAEEKRDLRAHEHGIGALNIAFEGSEVAMEFEAPGADIVGFEHRAESAGDRAMVDSAIASLAKPLDLFRLPEAAKCTLVAAEVELQGGEDERREDDGRRDERAKVHPKGGDHHEELKDAGHTEFHAEYRLACAAPGSIDRIEFGYFESFPNAEELEVQMISEKGANGFEVKRDDPVLDLGGLI